MGRSFGGAPFTYGGSVAEGGGGTMRRGLALGGMVVALAISAAACGGGNGGEAAVSIKTLQAAVSNTQDADSTRFTMDITVDAAGHQVSITGEGITSADGKQAQLT